VRVLLGAFGDPGHAFPMIALGRALQTQGHEVTLQTWRRWQRHVEAEGLAFAPAPEYQVFPSGPEPLDFYEAVVHATRDTLPLLRARAPDVVVADILTLAPALNFGLDSIARAIAVEPEVLLMDEPASALDPIATMKIEELIHELVANYTIVIVTHNMQQASRVSDRTAFFYVGRLIEFGETTQIFTQPKEKQTEDYITGRFG